MNKPGPRPWLLSLVFFLLLCSACSVAKVTPSAANIEELAALQATNIVSQARATALVQQALQEATAMLNAANQTAIAKAQISHPTVTPQSILPTIQETVVPSSSKSAVPQPTSFPPTTQPGAEATATDLKTVTVTSVTYGAEGAYIVVNYLAPPRIAQTFWPGALSVTDEATGAVYNEVPVMPIIGPLIARPKENGQPAYVMFVNAPVPLHPGSQITIVLGEYRFEHLVIR